RISQGDEIKGDASRNDDNIEVDGEGNAKGVEDDDGECLVLLE
ncbi:3929_t:CDS:2, partial [Entrophospora sp. SA101]